MKQYRKTYGGRWDQKQGYGYSKKYGKKEDTYQKKKVYYQRKKY